MKFASTHANTQRILARGIQVSNDTWATGLNNNDLIIGPSGAGKTRGYVKPNILQCNESLVVADTKGNLMDQVGPVLSSHGYKLLRLDLKDISRCTVGYNSLDYVEMKDGVPDDQGIARIANVLAPQGCSDSRDPFWENAARQYIIATLAYIMESLPPNEHHLGIMSRMLELMGTGAYHKLLQQHSQAFPNSLAARTYRLFRSNRKAEKMDASIIGIAGERLTPFVSPAVENLALRKYRLRFADLGREKTALFLCVSDTDRSMDRIVSMVYTQALHDLIAFADAQTDGCLPVPVRFILDDFATNALVPDFQGLTSVIRSRGVSVSIILQSLTQLNGLYGIAGATTITNNCDHWLYLGGMDMGTVQQMAMRVDKREQSVLGLKPHRAYVLERGQPPREAQGYKLEEHPLYGELPEAMNVSEVADEQTFGPQLADELPF